MEIPPHNQPISQKAVGPKQNIPLDVAATTTTTTTKTTTSAVINPDSKDDRERDDTDTDSSTDGEMDEFLNKHKHVKKTVDYVKDHEPQIVGFVAGASASVAVGAATTLATGGNIVLGSVVAGATGNVVTVEVTEAMKAHKEGRKKHLPKTKREAWEKTKKHAKMDALPALGGAIGGGVAGALSAPLGSLVAGEIIKAESGGAVSWAAQRVAATGLQFGADNTTQTSVKHLIIPGINHIAKRTAAIAIASAIVLPGLTLAEYQAFQAHTKAQTLPIVQTGKFLSLTLRDCRTGEVIDDLPVQLLVQTPSNDWNLLGYLTNNKKDLKDDFETDSDSETDSDGDVQKELPLTPELYKCRVFTQLLDKKEKWFYPFVDVIFSFTNTSKKRLNILILMTPRSYTICFNNKA